MKRLRAAANRAVSLLGGLPTLLIFLGDPEIGRRYGVGLKAKLRLVYRFARNVRGLETLSSIKEHMELARAIFAVPPEVEGDVVECGCYVGGSSANISLACRLAGRRLVICDSFEGLPEPDEHDRTHVYLHHGTTDEYYEGRFAATIDTVRANIARWGEIEVCDLVPGFFQDTLPQLNRKVVLAFLDVDLIDSLKPCLMGLWPHLAEGCRIYVHEAGSLALVALFFDAAWWREQLEEDPPGFVGAGTGLPLTAVSGSKLGYAQKGVARAPARQP
jgi:O-methyltransferase